jgi:hypothetical protein
MSAAAFRQDTYREEKVEIEGREIVYGNSPTNNTQ